MGSAAPESIRFPIVSLAAVVLLEAAAVVAGDRMGIPRLWLTGAVRTLQAAAVCAAALFVGGGLGRIGLDRKHWCIGLKQGLGWSAGFAVAAGLMLAGLWIAGFHPLSMIRATLPASADTRILYFIVGGGLAPIAEEIVFRGVVFGGLRRLGLAAAVLISTALFAAAHPGPALPVTQIVGGVVFALAYHKSGSLVAPIVIHCLGNLSIFTLSLLP